MIRRPSSDRRRSLGAALVIAVLGVLVGCGPELDTSTLPVVGDRPAGGPRFDQVVGDLRGRVGVAGGQVPDGAGPYDDYPAVTNLDPDLLEALRRAADDARSDGYRLQVNSGWRSAAYQSQLLSEAVSKYGSLSEASRWVATPETSPHVSGDAVDVGGAGAARWLADHGSRYDLCRIYDNEPWHFELRDDASEVGCPARYADPTQDPRMHR